MDNLITSLLGHNMATTVCVLVSIACITGYRMWVVPELKRRNDRIKELEDENNDLKHNPPIHESQITDIAEKLDAFIAEYKADSNNEVILNELGALKTELIASFSAVKISVEEIAQSLSVITRALEDSGDHKLLIDLRGTLQLVHETNSSILNRVNALSGSSYPQPGYGPQDHSMPGTYGSPQYHGSRELKR